MDSGEWTFEYDDAGLLLKRTDAAGRSIEMTYDAFQRRKTFDPSDGPGDDAQVRAE